MLIEAAPPLVIETSVPQVVVPSSKCAAPGTIAARKLGGVTATAMSTLAVPEVFVPSPVTLRRTVRAPAVL